MLRTRLRSAFIFAAAVIAGTTLAPSYAQALIVTVSGTTYDIGFVEGCFTNNDLTANPPYYQGCGTGYTTQDLYANGAGVLVNQPWWGNSQLAFDLAKAYRDAALIASGAQNNDCNYHPNVGGAGCDDSPYFVYAVSPNAPYYEGWGYFFYTDPNTAYLRQSGFFAVVQSVPAPGPAALLGLLVLAATALRRGQLGRPIEACNAL